MSDETSFPTEKKLSEQYSFFPGKKNVLIKYSELTELLSDGHREAFEGEFNLLLRQQLFGYDVFPNYFIPDWDRFIHAVDAYYVVCYKEEDE